MNRDRWLPGHGCKRWREVFHSSGHKSVFPILPNITLRRTLNQIETSTYCNSSSARLANRLSASTCLGYRANILLRILDYKPRISYAWIELNQGQTEYFAGVRGGFSQAAAECLQGLVVMTGQIPLPQLQSLRLDFRPHLDFFSCGMIMKRSKDGLIILLFIAARSHAVTLI